MSGGAGGRIPPSAAWAGRVAEAIGFDGPTPALGESAAQAWARSGALWLTGPEDGPPTLPTVALPSCMEGALAVLRALAPDAARALSEIDGARLLGERAAIAGLRRRGRVAPGGSARLLRGADGWLAVNLPREDDRRSLPAWLGIDATLDWTAIEHSLSKLPVETAVSRGRLLGLATAGLPAPDAAPAEAWLRQVMLGAPGPAVSAPGLVLDLSSLWAGPLCADLLRRCGARVVKVESERRPDGARAGPPAFYDLLNTGKQSVALDFGSWEGRAALQRLVAAADVVIEGSRPRALAQLGLDAAAWLRARPGRVWLSLTAYGLSEPECGFVGFGDDVGAAAGLAWRAPGAPLFVADAVADPLAGVHGAVAALAALGAGRSVRLDVSLHAVASAVCAFRSSPEALPDVIERPHVRKARCPARPLGADTRSVLGSLSA